MTFRDAYKRSLGALLFLAIGSFLVTVAGGELLDAVIVVVSAAILLPLITKYANE